jgi:hypothetical protein
MTTRGCWNFPNLQPGSGADCGTNSGFLHGGLGRPSSRAQAWAPLGQGGQSVPCIASAPGSVRGRADAAGGARGDGMVDRVGGSHASRSDAGSGLSMLGAIEGRVDGTPISLRWTATRSWCCGGPPFMPSPGEPFPRVAAPSLVGNSIFCAATAREGCAPPYATGLIGPPLPLKAAQSAVKDFIRTFDNPLCVIGIQAPEVWAQILGIRE